MAESEVKVPVVDHLYEFDQRKKQNIKELKKAVRKEQLKECTFKPNVRSSYKGLHKKTMSQSS